MGKDCKKEARHTYWLFICLLALLIVVCAATFCGLSLEYEYTFVYDGQPHLAPLPNIDDYYYIEKDGREIHSLPVDAGTYLCKYKKDGLVRKSRLTILAQRVPLPEYDQTYLYDGKENEIKLEDGRVIISGEKTAFGIGEHHALAELKDNNNYVWSDGTTDTKTIKLTILPNNRENGFSSIVYSPFLNDSIMEGDSKEGFQENGLDYKNYWTAASGAITVLCQDNLSASDIDYVKKVLSSLKGTFDRYGYFPRPAYSAYEYGWVSSMDAPVIAVAALMSSQRIDSSYYDFVMDLIDYIKTSVGEGGFVLAGEDTWMLEYADTNSTVENSMLVLNGSLLGYLSLLYLSEFVEDDELDDLIKKVDKVYKSRFIEYRNTDNSWCFYMLNKLTVNPPHYMIFEIRLLDAIYALSGDEAYKIESDFRKACLRNQMEIHQISNGDGTYTWTFLRNIAPHPYYVDIYTTKIEFYNRFDKLIYSGEYDGRDVYSDAFVSGTLAEAADYALIYAVPDWELLFGRISVNNISTDDAEYAANDYSVTTTGDAEKVGDSYRISARIASDDRANIYLKPSVAFDVDGKLFAVEIYNDGECEYAINVVLYDENGTVTSRYLKALQPGKNVYVLSNLGFADYATVKNVQNICLRVYTFDDETRESKLTFGRIICFDNQAALYKYYKESNYIMSVEE